ncbi:MAG: efflux RND transporter periplasmic adaptor subunit [Verrucomicrobia bacterium]|jgi:RND family efflux transporter MFP subunit|nr:efflux RND transporter periplasmic adaptor subunit [Verrucomicrobiota bacterium]
MDIKQKMAGFIGQTWKLWVGFLGLVVIVLWTAGVLRTRTEPGKLEHAPGFALPADAATIEAKVETVHTRVDVVGTVQSERKIHLSSRISAYIKDVLVSAGKSVKEGDLLVELDQREIREQLAASEAQLAQAETAFQRAKRLLETNATTPQDYEVAESAFKGASANVDGIKVMLSYTRIVSPLDGIVTDRRIEIGDLANPGQVLLSVYDASRMRMEVSVPVRLVQHFPAGRVVNAVLDQPERTLTGEVAEIVSEVDSKTRTQLVKIQLRDATAALPGAYGHVWVESEPHDAVMLPASAVYGVGQLEFVQIVRGDRVLRRLVRTGPRVEGRVEILSGLVAGEQVLLNPVNR